MADKSPHWRIGREVAYEFVEDEAVALNLRTGTYYRLNPVAAKAWRLLAKGSAMGAVVDRLFEEFEVDRDSLEADLRGLFADLERYGLLTRKV